MEFPDELILEKLSWLPTKDVIRYSSVSRTLNNMIKEPFFVNLHTRRLSTNHSPLFVTSQATANQQHSTISFCIREGGESGMNDPTVYRFVLPYRANIWNYGQEFKFSCLCNGLVCAAPEDHRKPIVLCNPHALEYITVPSCIDEIIFGRSVGFGYSASTEEYKLVCITFGFHFEFSNPKVHPGKVMVYTIGASTPWRKVADAPFNVRKRPLYANGQVYWVVDFGGYLQHRLGLVAFDIETEEYLVIDNITGILSSNIHNELQLVELEGRVSVAFYKYGCIEIWMPKDGNISHWEQRHNISIPRLTINNFKPGLPMILGIWERDRRLHVWLQDCSTMMCDKQGGSRFWEYEEGPNLQNTYTSVWQLCSSYTPSMVSLKKYGCNTGERVIASALGIEPPPAISLPPTAKATIRPKLDNEEYMLAGQRSFVVGYSCILWCVLLFFFLCVILVYFGALLCSVVSYFFYQAFGISSLGSMRK